MKRNDDVREGMARALWRRRNAQPRKRTPGTLTDGPGRMPKRGASMKATRASVPGAGRG